MTVRYEWGPVTSGGSVYALLFSDGGLKVGKTRHLMGRIGALESAQRREFGVTVTRCYFTRVHDSYSATEDFALEAAERSMTPESVRISNEWFQHIDFERFLGLMAELDPTSSYNSPDVEQVAA